MIHVTVADIRSRDSEAWRARLRSMGGGARLRSMYDAVAALPKSLVRVRPFRAGAWYFQLERQGPFETRLGPGLSRASDSFWALSEW
jgi:hypothetical protein